MPNTTVYLRCSRGAALADFITSRYGLEVPMTFEFPREVSSLPDTMPKYPMKHDRYYADGGSHWPERVVVSA